MQRIEKTIDELNQAAGRYGTLRSLFNEFQKSVEEAGKTSFPVKGIAVTTASPIKTEVNFLDRQYVICFSVSNGQGVLEFARVESAQGHPKLAQLASAGFNGQGVLNIKQPPSEDPMNLKEISCCLNLLSSWLLNDVSA